MKNIKIKRILSLALIILVVLSTFIASISIIPNSYAAITEVANTATSEMVSTAEDEAELEHVLYEWDVQNRYAIFCSARKVSWSAEDITGFSTEDGLNITDFKITKNPPNGGSVSYTYKINGEESSASSGTYDASKKGVSGTKKTTGTWYDFNNIEYANPMEAYILAEMSENIYANTIDSAGSFVTLSDPITREEFLNENGGVYRKVDGADLNWPMDESLLQFSDCTIYESFRDGNTESTPDYYIEWTPGTTITLDTEKVEEIIKKIVEIAEEGIEISGEITEFTISEITSLLESFTEMITNSGGTGSILDVLPDVIGPMLSSGEISGDVIEVVENIFEDLVDPESELWSTMGEIVENTAEIVKNTFVEVWNGFSSLFDLVGATPEATFGNEINSIHINKIQSLIGEGSGTESTGDSGVKYYKINSFSGVDIDSVWASYVQRAWWSTDENEGEIQPENWLGKEAEEFYNYIARIKVDGIDLINPTEEEFTEEHEIKNEDGTSKPPYNFEGKTVDYIVYGPKLDYEPKWHKDYEPEKAKVSWDEDENIYRVGPYAIDYLVSYYERHNEIEEKDIVFSDICDATVYTNLGEYKLDTDGDLGDKEFRIFNVSTKTSEYEGYKYPYPSNEEYTYTDYSGMNHVISEKVCEFYIDIPFNGNLETIENIQFDFRYMNAGAKFMNMYGHKYTYSWKYGDGIYNISSTVTDIQKFSFGFCGARWYEKSTLKSDNSLDIPSYYEKYLGDLVIKKEVTDEAGNPIKVEKDTVYEFNVEITRYLKDYIMQQAKDEHGNLMVDEEGNPVMEEVAILNEAEPVVEKIPLIVKEGESTGTATLPTEYWEGITKFYYNDSDSVKEAKKQEDAKYAPKYKISEIIKDGEKIVVPSIDKDNKYKYIEENGTEIKSDGDGAEVDSATVTVKGSFANDKKVTVTAINKYKKDTLIKSGKLVLKKILADENGNLVAAKEKTDFKFNVSITDNDGDYNGKRGEVTVTVPKNSTSVEIEIGTATWEEGEEPPTFEIKEIEDPDDEYIFSKMNGSDENLAKGTFLDNATITIPVINEIRDDRSAQIKIIKNVVDKNNLPIKVENDTIFNFDVTITKYNEDGSIRSTKSENVSVTVPKDSSMGVTEVAVDKDKEVDGKPYYTWTKNQTAPTYEIKENTLSMPSWTDADGNTGVYEFVEIKSSSGKNDSSDKSIVKGKLSDEEVVKITAKNKREKGDEVKYNGQLLLTKKLVDANLKPIKAEKDLDFKFKVKVTGYGDKEGTPEKQVVLLPEQEITVTVKKDNESATINLAEILGLDKFEWDENVKAPTYVIEETGMPTGYQFVSISNTNPDSNNKIAKGSLKNGEIEEVIAINKQVEDYEYVTLKIKKKTFIYDEVEDKYKPYAVEDETPFNFKVNVKNVSTGEVLFNDTVTITLAKGDAEETETVGNFPRKPGEKVEYTVEEVLSSVWNIYSAECKDLTGELDAVETKIATVANVIPEGTITEPRTYSAKINLTKKLIKFKEDGTKDSEYDGPEKPETFYFNIRIDYSDGTSNTMKDIPLVVSAGKLEKKEEIWSDTWTSEDVVYPVSYKIEEQTPKDGIYKYAGGTNESGEIQDGGDYDVTVTNSCTGGSINKGKLKIVKKFVDQAGNEIKGRDFKFTVTVNGKIEEMIIKSGESEVREFEWTGSTPPIYTVVEDPGDDYEMLSRIDKTKIPDSTVPEGTREVLVTDSRLIKDNTVVVEIVNKLITNKSGKLNIEKIIASSDKTTTGIIDNIFKFKVTIYYDDPTKVFTYNNQAYNTKEIYLEAIAKDPGNGAQNIIVNKTFIYDEEQEKIVEKAVPEGMSIPIVGTGTTADIEIGYNGDAPKYKVQEIDRSSEWYLDKIENQSGDFEGTVNVKYTNVQHIVRKKLLTMEIGGTVWNDTDYTNGKPADSGNDGIRRPSEEGLANVIVNVYKDGTQEYSLKTDENGHWELKNVPVSKAKQYNIEFVYDGQTFEPTTPLVKEEGASGNASDYMTENLDNRAKYMYSSMAKEDTGERESFNKDFAEIWGTTGIKDDGTTNGSATSYIDGLNYTSKDANFGSYSKKVSTLITKNEDGTAKDEMEMKASTGNCGITYPFDTKGNLQSVDREICTYISGVVKDQYKYYAAYPYLNNINLGLVERPYADIAVEKELEEAIVVVNGKIYKYKYGEIANTQFATNPDLLYRQIQINQENISYDLNLYKSDYYYRASMYEGSAFHSKLSYLGDISDELDLDIYLTYKITVTNESDIYDVYVKELSDYADDSLELITTDQYKYIDDNTTKEGKDLGQRLIVKASEGSWSGSSSIIDNTPNGDGLTYIRRTTGYFNEKLTPGASKTAKVSFKVKDDGFDKVSGLNDAIRLGEKNNIVEIDKYSTEYADTPNNRTKGIVGNVAGRVEEDSAPGNISFNKNNINWYEDDTDSAPIIKIGLYEEIRDLNGLVWEDEQTKKIQHEQVIGDGKFESANEKTIPNMTTEFVEKVLIEESGNKIDYDFIWPTDTIIKAKDGSIGTKTIKELTGFDSQINTDSQGKYEFTGIPAGNYVVRFTYGDNDTLAPESPDEKGNIKYSGQDYKSTTYQTTANTEINGITYNWNGNNNITSGLLTNEWHDLYSDDSDDLVNVRVSDARDDEARRLEVIRKSQNISYENSTIMREDILQYGMDFVELDTDNLVAGIDRPYDRELKDYYMTANTAKINMNIESKLDSSGGIKEDLLSTLGGVTTKVNMVNTNLKTGGAIRVASISYTVNNIDFGIETRSESNIELDKQIEEITLRTSSGDVIMRAKYNITYEYIVTRDSEDRIISRSYLPKTELIDAECIGIENLQALNRNIQEENSYLGFRYLNVDKDILQGATIEIKYKITALNTGEVDRCGIYLANNDLSTMSDTDFGTFIHDNITVEEINSTTGYEYGKYLGKVYYQGANGTESTAWTDEVVASKVKQVIDYVDNDVVFSQLDNTSKNGSWANITTPELEERRLIDNDPTENIYDEDGNAVTKTLLDIGNPTIYDDDKILDSNGVAYEAETKNNIAVSIENATGTELANPEIMTPIQPGDVTGTRKTGIGEVYEIPNSIKSISLTVSRYYASDIDIEEVENISEILKWYNDVGRRDPDTVQGNVKPALGPLMALISENDASATEIITLSPPTGAITTLMYAIQVMAVILSALTILAGGIVLIKKKVLTK